MNFDGSFNPFTGKAGIGGLIRDPYGNMIVTFFAEALAKFPLESKLFSLQRGIAQLKELEVSNIQIGGDCLVIISTIQHSNNVAWDLMPLWQDTMHVHAVITQQLVHPLLQEDSKLSGRSSRNS